jgi:cytochrome c oxidase subunit II
MRRATRVRTAQPHFGARRAAVTVDGRHAATFVKGANTAMQVLSRLIGCAAGALAMLVGGGVAFAGLGQPSPWQLSFQESASPVMNDIVSFHDWLLVIITVIAGFVLVLLLIVMVRFNRRANPNASRNTHNTLIEVLWTVVPIIILTGIAIPSFKLLFYQQNIPPADLTVKATGYQWYWNYGYPDNGKFDFDSRLLADADRKGDKANEPRLLGVDNELVVPVNKVVRVIVTGDPGGVIHSFTVPSFGIKIDAVPGRLNETWFQATREGKYYGQCSELCGKDHAYMPISVRVVSEQEFTAWLEQAKKKYARDDASAPTAVAAVPAAPVE